MTDTNFIEPQLMNSQFTEGMQNKKFERQAVKGLTPKYAYAKNTNTQNITAGTIDNTIVIDTYSTNDKRMTTTNNYIVIPSAGLYAITATCFVGFGTTPTSGDVRFFLKRNDYPDLGTTGFVYTPIQITYYNAYSPIESHYPQLTAMALLNQGDKISIAFNNNTSQNNTISYVSLRVISYIQY